MATNCDSCGHRTNEVSWKEGSGEGSGVPCLCPCAPLPSGAVWEGNWIWGTVRRCFMLGGEATVPGLEWPLGCWDKPC